MKPPLSPLRPTEKPRTSGPPEGAPREAARNERERSGGILSKHAPERRAALSARYARQMTALRGESLSLAAKPPTSPVDAADGNAAGINRDGNPFPAAAKARGAATIGAEKRRANPPARVCGAGVPFRVRLVHNDGGTPLFDLAARDAAHAHTVAQGATRRLLNASAYIMPGFLVYRAGRRMNP